MSRRFSNPSLPQRVKVTLVRDGFNQPWGFRLGGGVDVGTPLTILRLLKPGHVQAMAGTPSEGELRPGDVVCKIGEYDARHLTHADAQTLFLGAGNNISVVVERGGSGPSKHSPLSPPLPPAVASLPKPPVAGGVATPFAMAAAPVAPHPAPAPAPAPTYAPAPAPAPAPTYAPAPALAPASAQMPLQVNISPAAATNNVLSPKSPAINDHYSKPNPVQSLPVTVFPPPLPGFTPHAGQPRRPVTPNMYAGHFDEGAPELIDNQPYRTTPLVLPGAKTKREVPITSYLRHHPNPAVRAAPHHFDTQADVLMKQKVVHQFNSPIALYSDQNIVETVHAAQSGVTPYKGKKTLYYDPAKSETFRALKDSELGDTVMEVPTPIQHKVFTPQKHIQPPLHQMQRPQTPKSPQPNHAFPLGDEKIHQSYSFRRLMNEVLGESEF